MPCLAMVTMARLIVRRAVGDRSSGQLDNWNSVADNAILLKETEDSVDEKTVSFLDEIL